MTEKGSLETGVAEGKARRSVASAAGLISARSKGSSAGLRTLLLLVLYVRKL
jgi:hypothetical protein